MFYLSSSVFLLFSVRFIEENTKPEKIETGDKSKTDATLTVKTKVLQDLIINNGGGLINSWVDSMRACSPTHLKSSMKQSSWLVSTSLRSSYKVYLSMLYLFSYNKRGLYNFRRQNIHQLQICSTRFLMFPKEKKSLCSWIMMALYLPLWMIQTELSCLRRFISKTYLYIIKINLLIIKNVLHSNFAFMYR